MFYIKCPYTAVWMVVMNIDKPQLTEEGHTIYYIVYRQWNLLMWTLVNEDTCTIQTLISTPKVALYVVQKLGWKILTP